MRTIFLTCAAYSIASLLYEYSVEKLVVLTAVTILLPLALTIHGKRIAKALADDRRDALELQKQTRDIERKLKQLKEANAKNRKSP